MAKERLCNKRIHGPQGVLLTLKNIDFERIRDLGLQTMVVMYLSRGTLGDSFGARYDGPIYLKDGCSGHSLSDLALLQPKYGWFGSDDFKEKIIKENLMPASVLFVPPSNLEFVVSATNPQEYQGLLAFRDFLIPELFRNGYDNSNSNHTSAFWLHAGKDQSWGSGHLLCIDPHDGLSIGKTEVDGVKVFTEMDVEKLLSLKMDKKDYK